MIVAIWTEKYAEGNRGKTAHLWGNHDLVWNRDDSLLPVSGRRRHARQLEVDGVLLGRDSLRDSFNAEGVDMIRSMLADLRELQEKFRQDYQGSASADLGALIERFEERYGEWLNELD